MERFVDIKRVLQSKHFFQRDLETDILAETLVSFASQYGPRLHPEHWNAMLLSLEVVCEVINEQQAREEYGTPEKILRCVEWFEAELTTTLGPPRQRIADRRKRRERRNADRRRHDGTHYTGPERRAFDRRKMDDRRNNASRRNDAELF